MSDVVHRDAQQRALVVSGDLAKRVVDPPEGSIQRDDGHPDRCVFEGEAEALLGFL